MLHKNEVLTRMLSHFAKWMDIRRKPYSSTGGRLVTAISEEVELLQEAINDYVDFHFLNTNIKNQDVFLSHVYSVQIGAASIKSIELITPSLKITDNLDLFYKQKDLAYYQDGFLFIRMEHVKGNIKYLYEGYTTIAEPIIKHVWNIFDEFALFVGLNRYELESNASLIKRILLSRREKINNTKEGLQYAIYSALANFDETLSTDEIIIELPSSLNMNLLTEEGNTIIDEIGKINRDIYRYKRWDIDNWKHDLNNSSFLPHQWDYPIDYFKNGIGDNEDLKTYLLSRNEFVSATIKMYQKDEESMISYINDNKIKENLTLTLIKPLDTINPIIALYKITAHNLVDITPNNLGLKYTGTVKVDKYVQLADLINTASIDRNQFEYEDKRCLKAGRKYQINIAPKFSYGNVSISKCSVVNSTTGAVTDLLVENGGFEFDSNDILINPTTVFFGSKTDDFDTVINAVNTPNGLSVFNQSKITTVTKKLIGCASEPIQINTFCDLSDVGSEFITAIGFDKHEGAYANTAWNSSMTIELKANHISTDIVGNALVKIYNNNVLMNTYFTNGEEKIATPTTLNPVNYKITISPVSQSSQITIKNIKYSSYEVLYSTEFGKITSQNGIPTMPAQQENTLKISLISNTNFSPILLGVHVGRGNEGLSFNTKVITAGEGDMLFIENDYSFITLSEYDSNNNLQRAQENYIPSVWVKAINDNAVLELNLNNYASIETVFAPDATYKVLKVDGITKYYLFFKKGAEITSIYIKGSKKTQEAIVYFNELFGIDLQRQDKLYISNAFEGLIVLKNTELNFIKLNEYPALKHIFSNGSFEIINYETATDDHTIPNTAFSITFVKAQEDGTFIKSIGSLAAGNISNIYFSTKDNLTFVAHNKFISYKEEEKEIPIINTFYPFIKENELYLYKVEPVSNNIKVAFYDPDLPFDETRCYGIGKNTLHLFTEFNVNSENAVNTEKKYITKQVELLHTVELNEFNVDNEGNYIDLKEYLIKPPKGMNVFYYEVEDQDFMSYPDAFYTEKIIIEEDGFNKLKYCHINKINSVRLNSSNGLLVENGYELIREIGIVRWDESLLKSYEGQTVYINYKIDLPLMVQIGDDIIYKSVEKIENAHKLIKSLDISFNINNSDTIDLSNNQYYTKADFVTINFNVPGYVAEFKPSSIKIKKIGDLAEIAIHSGFYYFDEKEYYLFSNATQNDIKNIGYVTLENVDKFNNHIIAYNYNENYVRNSRMITESFGKIYDISYLIHDNNTAGVSYLNYISACDSFSKWMTVGMNLKLVKGLNDQAISFSNLYKDSYAMLDITSIINDKDYITCYVNGSIEFYIGSEPKYENTEIKHVYHIDTLAKIQPVYNQVSKQLTVDPDRNYYIIVKGSGVIDDLIICDAIKYESCKNIHTKNIDYFNLAIEEDSKELENTNRFAFTQQLSKNYSATIDERGYIVNSSNIDWTLTKFKSYEVANDWKKCELKNLTIYKDLVKTNINQGILITEDIYLGNPNSIKKVIIKINDIIFEQMNDIELEVLGASTFAGNYTTLYKTTLNNVMLYSVTPFIKLKLIVPADKIIKNLSIYIDYKSNGELKVCENTTGYYVSELFDTQKNNNITLTSIDIEDITQEDNVEIYVRGAKENFNNEIFSSWQKVSLLDGQITTNVQLEDTRYLQFKIVLNSKVASIKINYFEIKVG